MGKSCYFTKVKAKKIIKEKLFNVGGFPRAKLKEYCSSDKQKMFKVEYSRTLSRQIWIIVYSQSIGYFGYAQYKFFRTAF